MFSSPLQPSFVCRSPAHPCFVQDLLHTLQTAAEVELSLTDAPDQKTDASPQRRSLPHQQRPHQQQGQQPSLVATAGGGKGGGGGGSGFCGGVDASRSVRDHNNLHGEVLKAFTGDDSSGSSGDDDDDGTAIGDNASSVAEDDVTLAEEDAATEEGVRSSAVPGARSSEPAAIRTAAVGARAQELAAARFAGMRSAAETKSAAAATSSETKPEPSGSPLLGKGMSAVYSKLYTL